MGEHAGAPVTIADVTVGDDPAAWRSIGFAVDGDGTCRVGAVRIRLTGAGDERGRGIVAWSLAGAELPGDRPDRPDGLDGLPTAAAATAGPGDAGGAAPPHPNGATQLDHLVVFTPDLDRTSAAIESVGLPARRTREAGRGRLQRFFRLGEVILEVVGPALPSGDGPATFWGLAFTVADLDATAALLAGRVGTPKPAVQPRRRIATLRADRTAGAGPPPDAVSVPVAFMSAAEAAAPGGTDDTPR